MTLTTPTHYRVFNSPDYRLPKMPEMESLQGERSVSTPVFAQMVYPVLTKAFLQPPVLSPRRWESRQMPHLVLTSAFLQPASTATMHRHPEGDRLPPKMPKMESLQGERSVFYARWKMAHPALTRAFLQPVATVTMHCHPEGDIHPPPLFPPFLLAQNLSSKWIAPNDNMWPNFNDELSLIDSVNIASLGTVKPCVIIGPISWWQMFGPV